MCTSLVPFKNIQSSFFLNLIIQPLVTGPYLLRASVWLMHVKIISFSQISGMFQWNCSEAPSIGITATVYRTFVDFNVGIVSQQLVHHSVHHAVHLTRPASTGTTYIHTMFQKIKHLMFDNNFGKCGPIFKILSPRDS